MKITNVQISSVIQTFGFMYKNKQTEMEMGVNIDDDNKFIVVKKDDTYTFKISIKDKDDIVIGTTGKKNPKYNATTKGINAFKNDLKVATQGIKGIEIEA